MLRPMLLVSGAFAALILLTAAPAVASEQGDPGEGASTPIPDAGYAVMASGAGPITTEGVTALSSGTGGGASNSGSRDAWIKTKFYSLLGTYLCSFTSKVHWTWRGGVVTAAEWYHPTLSVSSLTPGSVTMTYAWGPAWWFPRNGKRHGGRYMSVNGHLTQKIFKWGVLGESDVQHEFMIHGSGTYWWSATT